MPLDFALALADTPPWIFVLLAVAVAVACWLAWRLSQLRGRPAPEAGAVSPAPALDEARRRLAVLERRRRVEEALERVRSQVLEMRQSTELAEVAAAVSDELQALGVPPRRVGISIIDDEAREAEVWATTRANDGVLHAVGKVSLTVHPVLEDFYAAWKRQDAHFVYNLSGDDLRAYLQAVTRDLPLPEWNAGPTATLPERMVYYHFFYPEGALYLTVPEPLDDESIQVMQQFTGVFSLAYTRHRDLKLAEGRMREVRRQASVDRVRAEITSMRTADDLQRITPLVWRELTHLGVPFFRCGVFIVDEEAEHVHAYLSTPEGQSLAALHLPFGSAPLVHDTVDHWRQRKVYTDVWDRDRFVAWTKSMLERGQIDAPEHYQGADAPPEQLALQFVPFTQGMLYIGSVSPLSEAEVGLAQTLADAFAVAYARYEDFRQLELQNQALEVAKSRVEAALQEVQQTQTQLVQSEKMASLGQMTAGIAHEIKNPLNFVNNFAELNTELTDEIFEELEADPDLRVAAVRDVLDDIRENASQITKHGKRADAIVKSMMQHARGDSGQRMPVAVNSMVEEYVNLAFHGMRASTPGFTAEIERDYDEKAGTVEMMGQAMGRVVLNLLSNAFYAVRKRADQEGDAYVPTVSVSTERTGGRILIRVRDNGTGMPPEVREKIFNPFFTTKPTGEGTGLGLSLSYDIITQGHGGQLNVESTEGEGTAFTIALPL